MSKNSVSHEIWSAFFARNFRKIDKETTQPCRNRAFTAVILRIACRKRNDACGERARVLNYGYICFGGFVCSKPMVITACCKGT
ncbi:MAG: hypothetical protein ACI4MR_07220, partial [Candidatus Aphodomorpha sp.]